MSIEPTKPTGREPWWMQGFLDWIPRVTIEGDPDEPVETGTTDGLGPAA